MYLMPDDMKNKPVDLLIRPGLVAEYFNDDSLGRCLDDLYAAGVTEVFASVVSRALNVYGIEHQFVHLDSSSFHLHGEYDVDAPGEEMVSITHGVFAGSPVGSETDGDPDHHQPQIEPAGVGRSVEWEQQRQRKFFGECESIQ